MPRVRSIVLLALWGSLVSCGPSSTPSTPPAAPPPEPAPTLPTEPAPPPPVAVVDYVTGTAQADSGAGWVDLDTGDKVAVGTTVRTGKASVLELKAGNLATLRLGAETVVKWEALVLDADRRRSQVQVLAGQVLNKVSKLVGDDSYIVRTKTVAMGVRGTQFLVQVAEASSVLAVKEGAVALMPPAFDPSAWQAAGAAPAAAFEKSLLAASQVVTASQRTEVAVNAFAAQSTVLEQLGTNLPDHPDAVIEAFKAATKKAEVQPLRPSDKKELQPLDAMPLGDVVPVSAPVSAAPVPPPPSTPTPPPVTRSLALTPGHAVASATTWPGGVAVSDGQGNLKAFSTAGKPLWSATVPSVSNPAVAAVFDAGDLVWTGDGALVVLDAKTGAAKRTVTLDATTSSVVGKRAIAAGSSLYLGASDGIAVFDRVSGARTGTLSFAEGTDMTPTLFGGQLFAVGRAGTLYAFDPKSATAGLKVATGSSQPVAASPLVDGKRVWFADRKGLVVAADRASGQTLWSVSVGSGVFDQPATDGRALFLTVKGKLHGLSLDAGNEAFTPRSASTPPLVAQERLWVGDGAQALALDPATGKPLWSGQASANVSAAAFVMDGEVAFPLDDGSVLLVNPNRL